MVCAINPSLDLHTDSSELLQLQQVSTVTCNLFFSQFQNVLESTARVEIASFFFPLKSCHSHCIVSNASPKKESYELIRPMSRASC